MNDGSIGSIFNEGHMTVEGEDAYCIDINTGFKNGYKTRSDASTRMTAYQIEDVALSLEYVKQYTKSHTGLSSQHAYLLRQLVVWQRSGNVLEPVNCEYVFSELVNPIFTQDGEQVKVSVSVKYLDQRTKATQISQFDLTLEKDSNWKIVK